MQVVKVLLAGGALMATVASAHHSGAMFDDKKTVTITGVVKRYTYTNPHVWLDVVTDENGTARTWSIEGGTPSAMKRVGLTPSVLKPGTKVTIALSPLRDGRRGGSVRAVTLPDGKTVLAGSARTGAIAPPKPGAERPSF